MQNCPERQDRLRLVGYNRGTSCATFPHEVDELTVLLSAPVVT